MIAILGSFTTVVIVCGSICFKTLYDYNSLLESKIEKLEQNEKSLASALENDRKIIQELINS
jgi:hypothetical protein